MRSAFFIGLVAVLALTACSAERRDWRSAESADTVESYDGFIRKHPDSEHVTQAQSRLEQLAEDRDWERASQANTAVAFRQFLSQHPNGKWAAEARIRVENFALSDTASSASAAPAPSADDPDLATPAPVAAPPPVAASAAGNFGIQLGAFSTEAAALAEWQRLRGKHQAQLASLKPQVQRAAGASGGTLFRLQANVGAEAGARGICSALSQASQPCVVVLPPR